MVSLLHWSCDGALLALESRSISCGDGDVTAVVTWPRLACAGDCLVSSSGFAVAYLIV